MKKTAYIPESENKRVLIVGGGFGGMKLAKKLAKSDFQVVLIDRHNYHQFQPLFYQVATAGLEPASISFPLRRIMQKKTNIHFRMANLQRVHPVEKFVETDIGAIQYDYLVVATGVGTNFFDMDSVQRHAIPMKTVSEAIYLRNRILMNFEKALNESREEEIESMLRFVIVGGGPTGVELAGALAEMKKFVLPKDYPELDSNRMEIHILEAGDRLLAGMSDKSGRESKKYLESLGVKVKLNTLVTGYDDDTVSMGSGDKMITKTVIWAAGVSGEKIDGFADGLLTATNRIKTDRFSRMSGMKDIFVIGDLAFMETEKYPSGHPQVAPVAIQQAKLLARNLIRIESGLDPKPFEYTDKGALATVGRKLAVADLPLLHLKGFIAWVLWLFVHLMSMVGIKNRFFVFINWMWNYVLYDQSLRIIIRPKLFKYQQKLVD